MPKKTLQQQRNLLPSTNKYLLAPWCSGCHQCTTSFNKARIQVLRRFKTWWRGLGDSRWCGYLKMVPAGIKAKHLSLVNHTTKHFMLIVNNWKKIKTFVKFEHISHLFLVFFFYVFEQVNVCRNNCFNSSQKIHLEGFESDR